MARENTMRAVVQTGYGSPDVLELRDVDRPEAGDGEVLVRVRAASVNHADWAFMRGLPYVLRLAFGLSSPRSHVRGRDVAGHVESVGAGVTRFRPGDEVYAEVDTGSFAEYAVAPEALWAPKPAGLTFEQAAAVPLAGVTALQALRDVGEVRPGRTVLVNGASGGVGTFAVQIAKALGGEVTGVCSTRNADLVRSIGADRVVDYTREDATRGGRRYDVILDLAGNHSLTALRRTLTPSGTLVLSSGTGGRLLGPLGRIAGALALSPFVGPSLRGVTAKSNAADLAALTELVESGRLTPAVDRTYPLERVPEALRYFEEEHARAKIVVTV